MVTKFLELLACSCLILVDKIVITDIEIGSQRLHLDRTYWVQTMVVGEFDNLAK